MDDSDRLREETIGTVEMIRQRAERLVSLAEACSAEARETEASTLRLRERAVRLREQALEYRHAAHAIETAAPGALTMVSISEDSPANPAPGDAWMRQDPVDPSTFRRFEFDGAGWIRRGLVNR